MSYLLLRSIHISCVALTTTLLLLRFGMALAGRDYRQFGPLRWIPHAVDTVLLLSAAALAVVTQQYPFFTPWLTAKFLALPIYIIAGAIALDPARTPRVRLLGGVASVAVLAYIIAVALTRHPWPPFAIWG